jgi:NitT/TauT family transport system permease protein
MPLHHLIGRTRYVVLGGTSFLVVLSSWSLLSASLTSPQVFLPSPLSVLRAGLQMINDRDFLADIWSSIWRVSVGYLLSLVVAIPLGLLAGVSRTFDALIQPLNDYLRYLPVASFLPLTILYLGIDDVQKIGVIFLGTVFQLIPLVADATARIPKHLTDLALTMGARRWQVLLKVVIPASSPEIYDHCRIALGWAWSYLVVAEIVAASTGIGHVIIQAQRFVQTAEVMFGIFVIGLLGLLFDQAFRLPKRWLFPWT